MPGGYYTLGRNGKQWTLEKPLRKAENEELGHLSFILVMIANVLKQFPGGVWGILLRQRAAVCCYRSTRWFDGEQKQLGRTTLHISQDLRRDLKVIVIVLLKNRSLVEVFCRGIAFRQDIHIGGWFTPDEDRLIRTRISGHIGNDLWQGLETLPSVSSVELQTRHICHADPGGQQECPNNPSRTTLSSQ